MPKVPPKKPSKPKRRKPAAPKAIAREPSPDDTLFEIRDIVEEKIEKGILYYLVDWADNPTTGERYDPTWEPAENVTEAAVADWEKQKRLRRGVPVGPENTITSAGTDSQPVLDPNWRARRRREDASVSEERVTAPKRHRHSVDSGYTSTQSTDGDAEADPGWAYGSPPEDKGDIVLEIGPRPGFDPAEYQAISSQSVTSPQAPTTDFAASQRVGSNPRPGGRTSQTTIPDSQDCFDSLRTESTVPSLATNPSQRVSQHAQEGWAAQETAQTSRSELDIPSRQPESSQHDSGPSSGLIEPHEEPGSRPSTSGSAQLGLDLPSGNSSWAEGFLTQLELPISVPVANSSRGTSASLKQSFPAVSDSLSHSQAAQRVSLPVSNIAVLTQISEVAGPHSDDIVPETVQRPPQRNPTSQSPNKRSSASSPLGKQTLGPSTTARDRYAFLPLTPQHQIMDDLERGNPPSAVERMRQLEESVFGSSAPPNPPAEPRQEEPPLISPSAVLPAPGNFAEQLEASAAPADPPAPEPPTREQQAVNEFNRHIDMAFNMPPENASMEYEESPATVAPADLTTTSVGHISDDQIVTTSLEEPDPESGGAAQFPLDMSAEKEDDHGSHFTVTLPMAANTRAKYLETISENKATMIQFGEVFANSSYSAPDPSLVAKIDAIFEQLLDLCDLPAYDNDLPELNKEGMMKHATNSNSKFSFVYEFLNSLWDINVRVLILSQPGRVFEYLEAVVSATDIPYSFLAEEGLSGQEPTEGAFVILAVTGQDVAKVQGGVDVVIAFDHTSRSVELPPTLGYESMAPIVLSLVATFSLDHIDQQLAQDDQDLDALERKNALNLATAMAKEYLRNPERQYTEPHEAAKTFTDFLRHPEIGLDWEPHPLPSNIFEVWMSSQERPRESQTQEGDDAPAGPPGRKRPLDNVDDGTPKRPRLLESQQPSRNATPARMSDLLKQTLANHSVQAKTGAQIIEVPVEQLEKMSDRIAELEAQLAAQSAIEAKMREQFISLESQLRSYERTVQTIQPKYMDALRDRGTFEKQCQKAVQQLEAQKAEVEALKEKNQLLESKLTEATDALANSTIPEAAKLAQAEKQRDEALASVDKLEKKIHSLRNEAEYSRKAYQDASNSHTELSQENQELRTRVAELERRAGENLFRIHQLHAQTETREAGRLVDELRAALENRERELERAREEVRVLRNGRRETRQASVPRSPRTGVMSPRPNRGVGPSGGGAGSRGTSPAPFMSSDGPGAAGGGGTPVPGMTFLPTAGNGGRWGHLREY